MGIVSYRIFQYRYRDDLLSNPHILAVVRRASSRGQTGAGPLWTTLKHISIQNQTVRAKTPITWIDVSCVSLSDGIRILFRQRLCETSLVQQSGQTSAVPPYSIVGIVHPPPVESSSLCYMISTWIFVCTPYVPLSTLFKSHSSQDSSFVSCLCVSCQILKSALLCLMNVFLVWPFLCLKFICLLTHFTVSFGIRQLTCLLIIYHLSIDKGSRSVLVIWQN